MGTFVDLKAEDGHSFKAYRAEPAGKPKGVVIVVQEIFGVNSHIRAVADGYAADGYLAIAPALFDRAQRDFEVGYSPADVQAGVAAMQTAGWDNAMLDLKATLASVKVAGKVGIVGYCWGGAVCWIAAAKLPGLAASVPYYGGSMPQFIDLNPACPVMCHFGEQDKMPSPEQARAILAAHPEVQGHFYNAGHGFNCDQRDSYNAEASKLAKSRTLEFFAKHLA